MELTREEIEKLKKLTDGVYHYDLVRSLAKLLLAEMDKPKVWDNAPRYATEAHVHYLSDSGKCGITHIVLRSLQKSRIDEIAESAMKLYTPNDDSKLTSIIKGAILAYAEEVK